MMETRKNAITLKIYSILTPLLGERMVKNILNRIAKQNNFTEDTISEVHLPKISEEIQKGLIIFLGKEAATKIASNISTIKN